MRSFSRKPDRRTTATPAGRAHSHSSRSVQGANADRTLIFINIGDSRAILSKNGGRDLSICSYDHKPQFFGEMQRIFKNGGQLYR